MKHYQIVFILTVPFTNLSLGMGISEANPLDYLKLAISMHNKLELTRPVSILKDPNAQDNPTTRVSILCDIGLRYVNGKPKGKYQIQREFDFYMDQFHKKPPENTIQSPNKMWINCSTQFDASRFSFNAEGKLMFDGKVLLEKNSNKKLNFKSFTGKSITIEKQKFPENTYRVVFQDWNNTYYQLYINTWRKEIIDYITWRK